MPYLVGSLEAPTTAKWGALRNVFLTAETVMLKRVVGSVGFLGNQMLLLAIPSHLLSLYERKCSPSQVTDGEIFSQTIASPANHAISEGWTRIHFSIDAVRDIWEVKVRVLR